MQWVKSSIEGPGSDGIVMAILTPRGCLAEVCSDYRTVEPACETI